VAAPDLPMLASAELLAAERLPDPLAGLHAVHAYRDLLRTTGRLALCRRRRPARRNGVGQSVGSARHAAVRFRHTTAVARRSGEAAGPRNGRRTPRYSLLGAGPGSGVARKETIDRAAVLLADARPGLGDEAICHSSMGVDREPPPGMDGVFVAYLRAKAAAEEEVPRRDLDWTILRLVGSATVGTGRVWLVAHVDFGGVPRDDVAVVITRAGGPAGHVGAALELVSGHVPIGKAVAAHWR
jgi:NAD(P)H-binding